MLKTFSLSKGRLLLFSACVGVLGGLSSWALIHSLDFATRERYRNPGLFYLLPAVGLFIGWAYHRFGSSIKAGHNLILEAIHDPAREVPTRSIPFIFLGSVLTHFVGGSTGREGAAVQLSAAWAGQIARFFRVGPEEKRSLLVAGAGAGFSSTIGTPLAGLVFGIEMVFSGPIRAMAILESLIACLFAMITAHLLGTPHSRFPPLEAFVFEWHLPFFAASAGLLFGMIARLFLFLEHVLEQIFGLIFRKPTVRGFAGGLLLLILFQLPGTLRYSGLGIESIQEAFRWPSSILDPFAKTGFTALSLASGFKGGEFVPLVFMGSTLGSALAGMIGLSVSFFAALGFASVFGAASKTPLACAVMAAEIFGWKLFPYAWISCMAAYLASGSRSLYRAQVNSGSKLEGLARFCPKKISF